MKDGGNILYSAKRNILSDMTEILLQFKQTIDINKLEIIVNKEVINIHY